MCRAGQGLPSTEACADTQGVVDGLELVDVARTARPGAIRPSAGPAGRPRVEVIVSPWLTNPVRVSMRAKRSNSLMRDHQLAARIPTVGDIANRRRHVQGVLDM